MGKRKQKTRSTRSYKSSRKQNLSTTEVTPDLENETESSPTTPDDEKNRTLSRELKGLEDRCRRIDNRWHDTKKSQYLGNRLIDLASLSDVINQSCICKTCGHQMKVIEKTVGIATEIDVSCTRISCKNKNNKTACRRTNLDEKCSTGASVESFALNCSFVLGMQQIGAGGAESDTILTYLSLPHAHTFHRCSFHRIEMMMKPTINKISDESMKQALWEEIDSTIGTERCNEWKRGNVRPEDVKLTVTYDMGWQKRSSGHKYDSTSGHGFMLGARTKKIIDSQCMSKECRVCTKYANDETPPPDHDCVKNHIGSSKSMEPEAIFRMVNRAFDVLMFTVAVITSDDDSSMKSTLKHSWQLLIEKGLMKKSEWPRTSKGHKKTDNGRLPLHIPEPTFLADFNHRVKVLGGKIYALANASKKESEVDTGFAGRLKAY